MTQNEVSDPPKISPSSIESAVPSHVTSDLQSVSLSVSHSFIQSVRKSVRLSFENLLEFIATSLFTLPIIMCPPCRSSCLSFIIHHRLIRAYIRIYIYIYIYTGCPRRKGPNFGRVFLRSNYTDITQNTYIQSSMLTEILAREV